MSTTVQRFGIELEAYGLTRRAVQQIVHDYTDDACLTSDNNAQPMTPLNWSVVGDGTIIGDKQFELRSPALVGEGESWDKIRAVTRALRSAGAKVNLSCGMHVHHDASQIVKAAMRAGISEQYICRAVAALYARMEVVLDSVMPPSRRQSSNDMCMSLIADSHDRAWLLSAELNQWGAGLTSWSNMGHHHKVSTFDAMRRHGTIEYRHHSGTLNAAKIIPWVKLTGLIHAKAAQLVLTMDKMPAEFIALEAALKWLGASQKLTGYWLARQAAVAKLPTSKTVIVDVGDGPCCCMRCVSTAIDLSMWLYSVVRDGTRRRVRRGGSYVDVCLTLTDEAWDKIPALLIPGSQASILAKLGELRTWLPVWLEAQLGAGEWYMEVPADNMPFPPVRRREKQQPEDVEQQVGEPTDDTGYEGGDEPEYVKAARAGVQVKSRGVPADVTPYERLTYSTSSHSAGLVYAVPSSPLVDEEQT